MTICNTDFFTIVLQSWTRQELFYKFVSKITNKLVKQLLSMNVDIFYIYSNTSVNTTF